MDHTQQKLWEAVQGLIGRGTLHERLRAIKQDDLGVPNPSFPGRPDLRERLDRVRDRLTSAPGIEHLSEEDAEAIAKEIFELFCRATELARTPVGFAPATKAR